MNLNDQIVCNASTDNELCYFLTVPSQIKLFANQIAMNF